MGQPSHISDSGDAGRVRSAVVAAALTAALALGGCVTNEGGPTASGPAPAGPVVAFDSIDGPPPDVFNRLVASLDAEARSRGLPVITREARATYRVRGYLAATVHGKHTAIAWTWDVYDETRQRRLRISGEEPAARGARDAWAAADDKMLRKIAQDGVKGLASLVALPPASAPPADPARRPTGPAMVEAGDTAPSVMAAGAATDDSDRLAFAAHDAR